MTPTTCRRVRSIVPASLALALVATVVAGGCASESYPPPAARGPATPADAAPDPSKTADAVADATPPLAPSVPIPPAAETPPPADAAAAGPRTHTLAKGDTFMSLSRKYYGTEAKWRTIRDANPGLNEKKLPVGKQITIP